MITTSANLKRHMERKHPLVKLGDDRNDRVGVENNEELEASNSNSNEHGHNMPEPSTSFSAPDSAPDNQVTHSKEKLKMTQSSVTTFVKRKMGVTHRKIIDQKLLLLFTHDYQPFSVVDDYGFKSFVASLNSSYVLPSRKTISNSLLPAAYEEVYNRTKNILHDVKSISLTTDSWTSQNSESFLAVTAHFLNNNFEFKTCLLECISFPESHTSLNLATGLKKISNEWNIDDKILIVVSDNAVNIKKAIRDELKLKHFGCYAHNLNLIAQYSLKLITPILEKVNNIVNFFKRSTLARLNLESNKFR
ncbi:hypothetical protein NQ314_011990 [Rhamnusium bicolor]|uniref:Transposase n=1 Tax=Rhamnusium bicolor TaxID=1586634 RepID=A0AAV8XFA4_9CUCU|nr:hypothetical protein NQ314_011990 [Rhamnusium bicolor]